MQERRDPAVVAGTIRAQDEERSPKTWHRLGGLGRWIGYIWLVAFALVTVAPFILMLSSSFKPSSLVFEMPPRLLPSEPTLNNYQRLFRFKDGIVLTWLRTSFVIAGAVTIANVLIDSFVGYALAKMRFPGRKVIFWAIVASMMIPGQVTLIPIYMMVYRLGWLNSLAAFIVPWISLSFGMFLMKQYMQTMPSRLIDAARIDGCSEWRIFWRIVLPLAAPGVAVLAIFVFIGQWNSFLWPLIVTQSADLTTIQVGLTQVRYTGLAGGQVDYTLVLTGAVIAALPMLIVFVVFQRYFLTGLTVGALKG
ncbi:MAG: carbohydrate ABC transporter permease [bacterium]